MWGWNRKIRPDDHRWASRGLPSDDKRCSRGTDCSILGPSINGLVTDGNACTKLCCRGFILALFQDTTANKIDFEHTRDYERLLPVCEAEILPVTVKKMKFFIFLC